VANEEACPRSFRRTVAKLCAGSPFDLIWVNYAKLLPAVPNHLRARAIVDTHDIQTTIFEAEQLPRYPRPLRPLLRTLFWHSEARLLRKAPTLISINPRESQILRSASPESRIVTIPAIVEASPAHRRPEGRIFDLLFIGSASHANAEGLIHFLERVFPQVIEARPGVTMLVVGRIGSYPPVTANAAVKKYQGAQLHFENHIDDVAKAYQRGRVVVAPILSGAGMKIKVVEAFAHGKCVVGTRLAFDGIGVEHERSAFISDDPRETAGMIDCLLREPKLRAKVEREARQLFEREHSLAVAVRTLRRELHL
jgi:glycosyltransferase involved in cell wall biosynthesis